MASAVSNDLVFSGTQLPVATTKMQEMAGKMWKPMIAMGFMIVMASFIVGLVNSFIAADYFEASQSVRDAASEDSRLATQKAFIESTKVWLPTLKFLGLGIILGGVTFLLATILGSLRVGGGKVQQALEVQVRILQTPLTAKVFPMVMMMGMMVLMASLVIGIVLGVMTYDYWNHSIANDLNPATGNLLRDLGHISAIQLWLAPFKFVGMAMLLTT